MESSVKDKLSKVYALVNNGATEGEREAAKKALDRLLEKYSLDESVLSGLEVSEYIFTYTTALELQLLTRIMVIMVPGSVESSSRRMWNKSIVSDLKYIDWITIDSAYEYFRRHMKAEWKRVVSPELSKCRKSKTRNRRRKELRKYFFSQYAIASKLYREDELKPVDEKMSDKEAADRLRMISVKGGQYNKQLIGSLLLTQ
ncbi:DUF2786 domain-containing protein [Ohtaekwangia kribbensis]|uniref:DUF2786 domain-containing protein n=1 Tax=Ohtaekwangia kribbensis TaxID=688913 RepID=A0ABW3JUT8_9BACT